MGVSLNLPRNEKREMERRKARLGSWCRSVFSDLEKQRPRKRLSDVPPRQSFSLGPLFEGTGGKPTAHRSRRISRRHLHLAQPSRGRPPLVGPGGVPRPPGSVGANHSRGRRISLRVAPPASFRSAL